MNEFAAAFVRSWPRTPWLDAALLLAAALYFVGWRRLRRGDPRRWPVWRMMMFFSGLLALFLALGSPIEPFAGLMLRFHMVQHLLLMMVVPPLLWLGTPFLPLITGLPHPVRQRVVSPLLRSALLRRCVQKLTHPCVALPVFVLMTWIWHAPGLYQTALTSPGWHRVQHACFLGSGMLFWFPVIRPFPVRPQWSEWLLLPYLLLADIQNTVLSSLLTFSSRVLYPYYERMPSLAGMTPLDDQATAGVLMWVPGSVVFLGPLFFIGIRLLMGTVAFGRCMSGHSPAHFPGEDRNERGNPERHARDQSSLLRPSVPFSQEVRTAQSARLSNSATTPPPVSNRFDVLAVPVLGNVLKQRGVRLAFQWTLLGLALLVVVDGWRGPQSGALNLAGVLPWIHWRGCLVLALLLAGNLFCSVCPLTLARSVTGVPGFPKEAGKAGPQTGRYWPVRLRNKWLPVTLTLLFLWSYEADSLWDRPLWTTIIICAYFVAAFLIDHAFRPGTFCKYVCPVGQFNFVQSLISPFSVSVRDPQACAQCTSQACLDGTETAPGCDSLLLLPRKQGNMDCTFCLNCVRACPHDNVGIFARSPFVDLISDVPRSGVGRLSQRGDLAVLMLLLSFGALANAAGMVGPVVDWENRFAAWSGISSRRLLTLLLDLLLLGGIPLMLLGTASGLSRRWGNSSLSRPRLTIRFAAAFVPLGFSVWLSHYSFHFLTSWGSIVPVFQRAAIDAGIAGLGTPQWICACCVPAGDWLIKGEILSLDAGLLLSLFVAWKIAGSMAMSLRQAVWIWVPWGTVLVLMFAAAVWIVFQPMEMRGALTLSGAGS